MSRAKEAKSAMKLGRMPPPRALADIEKNQSSMHARVVRWMRPHERACGAALVVLAMAILLGVGLELLSVAGPWLSKPPHKLAQGGRIIGGFTVWLLFFVVEIAAARLVLHGKSWCEPIKKADCEEMRAALLKIPNGNEFRVAVLRQGREFINEEFDQATHLSELLEQKEAAARKEQSLRTNEERAQRECRKLYDLEA